MAAAEHEVTRILQALSDGDESAADRLLPLVYAELRRRAEVAMSGQAGQTLQPTALVHEAWLRLSRGADPSFESRGHFVSVAAMAMRQILVDRARSRKARQRRDSAAEDERLAIAAPSDPGEDSMLDVLDLQEALAKLEKEHPRCARIAELRFFGVLDVREVARVLGASERTVYDDWRFARAWLRDAMGGGEPA